MLRRTSCSSARTCCSMDARVAAVSLCSVAACLRASSALLLALMASMACMQYVTFLQPSPVPLWCGCFCDSCNRVFRVSAGACI